MLLRFLSLLHPELGKAFDTYRQYSLAAARDMDELAFHVKTLVERRDLKQRSGPDFQITGEGWTRIGRMPVSKAENPEPISDVVTALAVGDHTISDGQPGGITVKIATPRAKA